LRVPAARAKLAAAFLLGLFLFAVAVLIADWYVGAAYRHVVVEVSNVDDIARVDVNCERALSLAADEGTGTADLGWLDPEDRVYLSEYNKRGGAAWGFRVTGGKEVVSYNHGHAGVTGQGAGAYGVGMAKLLTANGNRIGTIGCSPPGLVADSVVSYQQSPDARMVSKQAGEAPLWDPPRFPFALIAGLADLMPLFALTGFIVVASIARVRKLIRRHWRISLFVGALNLLRGILTGGGPEALLICFEGIGLILLLVSALVVVWPHTGSRCLTSCSTTAPNPNPE
jgi:hypothetical protein